MVVIGTGSALPARVVSNSELERMVDTSDEWITTRTGIKARHIAGPGESTSQLAALAAHRALAMAKVDPGELNLILVGTITPEMTMPSCACLVQKELGAAGAFAFDLNAACSGFLYALDVADKYIRNDPAMKILVIGAETLSTRVDWQDRNTCVLFGDGAGACLVTGENGTDKVESPLSPQDAEPCVSGHSAPQVAASGMAKRTTVREPYRSPQDAVQCDRLPRGYLGGRLYADGSLWELLHLGGSGLNRELLHGESEPAPSIKMNGREVFRYAVRAMSDAVTAILSQQGVEAGELKLVIPHQANIRIIRSLREHLGLPPEKVYVNVDKYGNTSAATIPIALDEANRQGLLGRDDLLLLCSFGGGFTWGASLLRW